MFYFSYFLSNIKNFPTVSRLFKVRKWSFSTSESVESGHRAFTAAGRVVPKTVPEAKESRRAGQGGRSSRHRRGNRKVAQVLPDISVSM